MDDLSLSQKMPVKVYYNKNLLLKRNQNNKNRINDLYKGYECSNYINRKGYSYPIAIYREPTLYSKYKERLVLSQKPIEKKSLLNKNYHHLYFNSHTNSQFLNTSKSYSNIKSNKANKINNPYKTFYKKRKIDNEDINKEINYTKQVNNNLSYTNFFNCNKNNKMYQNLYLSQVEKRGFNYNKIKAASLQRMAMNNNCKYDLEEDYYYNNKEVSYILESNKRTFFPQMKKFLINKYKNLKSNEKLDDDIFIRKDKSKGIIDIKNNPNFKFHIYHDQKGKIKELDKPIERYLKMTKDKLRDIKVMSRINKINDPEIIKMYKSII